MKFIVSNIGSRGDIQPYIAIEKQLLKAGLPSIPIPHIFDQFKTANKLYKSELACKPLNIHKLSAEFLSQKLSEVKNNKQIAERTKNIGLNIRKERGLEKAVEFFCKNLDR